VCTTIINQELIVGKISAYWQKVKHQVKYQACIVDFVLVNNMQDVYIVEINPFVHLPPLDSIPSRPFMYVPCVWR
jgi:DNA-binding sugar fermentation-stimulating protein